MKRPLQTNNDLPKSIRYLLETGLCWPKKGDWRDIGESWLRPYTLISPAGRDELKALWLQHRARILREWRGRKPPWTENEFDIKPTRPAAGCCRIEVAKDGPSTTTSGTLAGETSRERGESPNPAGMVVAGRLNIRRN